MNKKWSTMILNKYAEKTAFFDKSIIYEDIYAQLRSAGFNGNEVLVIIASLENAGAQFSRRQTN